MAATIKDILGMNRSRHHRQTHGLPDLVPSNPPLKNVDLALDVLHNYLPDPSPATDTPKKKGSR